MDINNISELLHERFIDHAWHDASQWAAVEVQLGILDVSAFKWMEETGGEPAIAPWWKPGESLVVCDCSEQSPQGRRSLCYDRAAWEKRKKARPESDAVGTAEAHGVRLMSEDEYLQLQAHGAFDTKTSSWLLTERAVREQGGALFGDRRFGRAFIYCNGVESYYSVRGFRVVLTAK